ncbi:pseudouridine synthase [Pedobacter heparinus]|uniref:pseudouridine synthase n=1 Tax=Pedobacter heparinus TaxID=984 RepID=UPI00293096D0|nr:pseudouridine synthase [Pedobacter heparinus]
MIKNNNRNSRDDKSKPGNRSTTSKKPDGAASSYKGKSKFEDKEGKENKAGDAKEFKPRTPGAFGASRGTKAGDKKEYKPRAGKEGDSRSYKPRTENDAKEFRPRSSGSDFKPRAGRDGDAKSFGSREKPAGESKRSYIKKDNFSTGGDKPFRKFDDKKSQSPRSTDSRPFRKREDEQAKQGFKPWEGRPERTERSDRPERSASASRQERNNTWNGPEKAPTMRGRKNAPAPKDDGLIRLNRYISNSGICSRRKADELIEAGVVSVNGEVVSELGHKIDPVKDQVRYNGELLKREKKVYVLLNKPKDYITTTDDPQERRTVMQLVEKASRERIYPVGRLDRNTTGLLLMTNDGELADKLSHPKNGITKIYHVELNRSLSQGDLNKIQFGLELEDGMIKPDSVSYVTGGSKREVGIQIHSGKNRIVRRIFEHLGYDVVKLDRVVYGNLTKKDLPRGRWRFLEEHELIQIKHLIK